jgi:pblB|uniref:Neck appendage protein n=1 Tax=Siphoviridae sp. ctAJN10 TaxID=2826181 RepID=A0A8S5M5A6_9CAUD|nr:MAG TPA: Neck appendage protein [Siphoviridae sp. ctAJN10]
MDIFRRQKFNEAMFAKNRTLAIRVGTYQSSDIKEASFEYGYIKGDTYKPGGTCAGSGKITFTSIITTFNKLDKIYPEIGLFVDGTYEWVKMGEYFINDIEIDRNRNTTTLDLMDGMFKLNREYVTDLTFPAEIRQVVKEICLKAGVELANKNMDITSMNYAIETKPKEKKMTFRDVLSLATQMLGMSCFFNREGKLEIKELTDSGIVITADNYFLHGLTRSEVEYQIAGITCKKDKEGLTVGTRTGRSLEIENPFMTQSILDNLYHKIKDIRYYPFNLNFQGHLLLEVGQWVTIKTNKGETFKSPVLSQSFNFKGGLRSRISADSKAGNDAQYSYAGTITKKIEQFSEFEKQLQNQIEEADREFDAKVDQIKQDFNDQIELAKAKAEENKRALSDEIDNRFSTFDSSMNEKLEDQRTKIEEIRAIGSTVSRTAEEALEESRNALVSANTSKGLSDSNFAKIEQITDRIRTLVTKQEFDPLTDRLRIAENRIDVQADQIIEKLSRTDFDRLATDRGFQNATQVQNIVNNSVDGFQRTISRIETKLRDVIRNDNLLQNSSIIPSGNGLEGTWRLNNSGGNGRTEVVTLTDSPHNAIKKGIRIVNNTNGENKDIAQGINLIVGEKYTMSCWAKVVKPNVNLLLHPWAPNNRNRFMSKPITNTDWIRYQFTFTADSTYNSIQFGQTGSGSLEICGMKLERSDRMTDYDVNTSEIVSVADFNDVVDTVKSHTQTIQRQNESISQVIQTADGLVSRVSNFLEDFNLVYDPTNFSKWAKKQADANVIEIQAGTKLLRITNTGKTNAVYHGFALPLNTSTFTKGEKLSYRMEVWVDVLPDAPLGIELWASDGGLASDRVTLTKTGTQIITGTMTVQKSSTKAREFPLEIWLMKNGQVAIGQVSLIRGDKPPKRFSDNTSTQDVVTQTQVSQLNDSYAIQTLTGSGAISSQINLNSNNILIEAAKIRLKGRTLLDEITAIDGYFKRLFVGDARIGTLNTDIIRSNSIAADKLIFDTALAKKLVASDVFTDTLAAKTAFINKLRSVVVSATLLEGYKGKIGGFQIGTHEKDPTVFWLTGSNSFRVGMSDGGWKAGQTALWVNWGDNWGKPGNQAWFVKNNGEMYCYNTANFWNTPVVYGNLRVTGKIYYDNRASGGKYGFWMSSPRYTNMDANNGYLYFYLDNGTYDWITLNKDLSDRRYKTNIKDSQVSGLDVIEKLKTYSYRKEYDGKVEDISCGIMAQDVQKYAPEAFFENPDGAYSYNTFALLPYLIKAIQELNQKVERLETT